MRDGFLSELLVRQLGVRFLMIGDDFRFGAGREGSYELLVELGPKYGFEVARSETFEIAGSRVSSTRIRENLAVGELITTNGVKPACWLWASRMK